MENFTKKTLKDVENLNNNFLDLAMLSTDPVMINYLSYDSSLIDLDTISRFTINGLKMLFPLIKIEFNTEHELIVENKPLGISTIPNINLELNENGFYEIDGNAHIEYIKEIMLDIFCLYQNDETKIPKNMYEWYFKK